MASSPTRDVEALIRFARGAGDHELERLLRARLSRRRRDALPRALCRQHGLPVAADRNRDYDPGR